MKTGIYKIENKVNGKIYIGQARNIEDRWKNHKSCLNSGKHDNTYLQRSWDKYGKDNFTFEVIEECKIEKLNELEIKYIRIYNSYTKFKNSNGYNMTLGGDGCLRISDIVLFSGEEYTIHEATAIYGDSVQTLQNYLNRETKMPKKYYDFGFRYKDDNETVYEIRTNAMHERVICDGVIYESVKECCSEYNVNPTTMLSWLDGRRYTPKKFIKLGLRYEFLESKVKEKPKLITRGSFVYCDNKIYRSLKIFSLYNKLSYDMVKRWMRFPQTNNEVLKDLLSKGLKYITKQEAIDMGISIINHDTLKNLGLNHEDFVSGTKPTKKKYNTFKVINLLSNKEYIFESKKDYIRNAEKVMGIKPVTMATIRKYQASKQPYQDLLFEVVS